MQGLTTIYNSSTNPIASLLYFLCTYLKSAVDYVEMSSFKAEEGWRGGVHVTVLQAALSYIIVQAAGFSTPVGMRNRPCHEMHWSHCKRRTV